jgi:hypothetical protein
MSNFSRIPEDQEIDLSNIGKRTRGFFKGVKHTFSSRSRLIYKARFLILILFVAGVIAGAFLDNKNKIYKHEIILIPNFGSVDYLYSKVELLNAKIRENDTVFLKGIGIDKPKNLRTLKIEPINDIYQFVGDNEVHFELLKLIADDENMEEVLENKVTSKNYPYHLLTFSTTGKTSFKKTINPLLNYFNDSQYYSLLKKQFQYNVKERMESNAHVIGQIDTILKSFNQSASSNNTKSSQLVYYNENTQLNEVLKTREWLIQEQGKLRLNNINFTKIIKDSSITMNMKSTEGLNGKLKFILPLALVALFIFTLLIFSNRLNKRIIE